MSRIEAEGRVQGFERLLISAGPVIAGAQGVQQLDVAVVDLVAPDERGDRRFVFPFSHLGQPGNQGILKPQAVVLPKSLRGGQGLVVLADLDQEPRLLGDPARILRVQRRGPRVRALRLVRLPELVILIGQPIEQKIVLGRRSRAHERHGVRNAVQGGEDELGRFLREDRPPRRRPIA
ncbi:MAG: hypothetical protein MZV64_11510 [Ignavibacteriales bacterium]|nr:hypothetical protein [Ignavibacteriales bacterium]MCK7518296.1 hypothetical protein [Ignavibacteriales bacterium]